MLLALELFARMPPVRGVVARLLVHGRGRHRRWPRVHLLLQMCVLDDYQVGCTCPPLVPDCQKNKIMPRDHVKRGPSRSSEPRIWLHSSPVYSAVVVVITTLVHAMYLLLPASNNHDEQSDATGTQKQAPLNSDLTQSVHPQALASASTWTTHHVWSVMLRTWSFAICPWRGLSKPS